MDIDEKNKKFNWNFLADSSEEIDHALPKVSIIIPTFNCSQSVGGTLKSVLFQQYPDLEVIIVDANSTDRTLEIVKSYYDRRVHIYTVAFYHLFEMLNKGISLAKGQYVNFLLPGDFYLQVSTLKKMMRLAVENQNPHLVYGATISRHRRKDATILLRPFTLSLLKRGDEPTLLQACWFRIDLFKMLGKFSHKFSMRGGYDLFCRFLLRGNLKAVSTNHVVIDYYLKRTGRSEMVKYILDSVRIISCYFGWIAVVRWFIYQKEIRKVIYYQWQTLKSAFLREPMQ